MRPGKAFCSDVQAAANVRNTFLMHLRALMLSLSQVVYFMGAGLTLQCTKQMLMGVFLVVCAGACLSQLWPLVCITSQRTS